MRESCSARGRPSRTNSSTVTRETRVSALSIPANTAATSTSTAAPSSSGTSDPVLSWPSGAGGRSPARAANPLTPGLEDPRLDAEHLALLVRLGVVVAEQVQEAVGAQHGEIGLEGVALRRRV